MQPIQAPQLPMPLSNNPSAPPMMGYGGAYAPPAPAPAPAFLTPPPPPQFMTPPPPPPFMPSELAGMTADYGVAMPNGNGAEGAVPEPAAEGEATEAPPPPPAE